MWSLPLWLTESKARRKTTRASSRASSSTAKKSCNVIARPMSYRELAGNKVLLAPLIVSNKDGKLQKGKLSHPVEGSSDDDPELQPLKKLLQEVDEACVLGKLNRHILSKFFAMTVLCYIDRTNLAFAALQLNKSLGFTETVYGLGSGVFFLGYSFFQIPSNMILVRLGAPTWLGIIVVAWGVVATLFAGIRTQLDFYVLRFLLGLTECGTFPGMWYHLHLFYSEKEMGVAYSIITAGTALSQVLGAPIAAGLLALDGYCGLKGWQWLFVVEGLPTIVLGVFIFRTLCEGPAKASFLTPAERDWLVARNQRLKAIRAGGSGMETVWTGAVRNWRTWLLAIVALLEGTVKNAVLYWCPLIIHSLVGIAMRAGPAARRLLEAPIVLDEDGEGSGAAVALFTAVPFGLAAAWMLLIAKHSQHTGERRWHSVLPCFMATVSLTWMAFYLDTSPAAAFWGLLGSVVFWGPAGVVSSLPATFLQGPAAAFGVALINSVGNLGGLVGPYMIGYMKQHHGTYSHAVLVLAGVTVLCGCALLLFPHGKRASLSLPRSSPRHGKLSEAIEQKQKGHSEGGHR